MKKTISALLLMAAVSAPAMADNAGRAYIAGDVGSATYTNAGGAPNPGVFRIAGGIHANRNLAIEVGYSMFGNSTVVNTLSASSFQVAAIGSLPLNPQFDLIGKIGFANNSATIKSPSGMTILTTSKSDMMFGFGAQFHVSSEVTLRAQYDSYGQFENAFLPMTATSVTVGAVFNL